MAPLWKGVAENYVPKISGLPNRRSGKAPLSERPGSEKGNLDAAFRAMVKVNAGIPASYNVLGANLMVDVSSEEEIAKWKKRLKETWGYTNIELDVNIRKNQPHVTILRNGEEYTLATKI